MWNVWNRLTATVRALRSRRRVDGEAEEELQFHLEMATRSYLGPGFRKLRRGGWLPVISAASARHESRFGR